MSSVAFTRTSAAPDLGAQSKMVSSTSGDIKTMAKGSGSPAGPGKAPFRHIDDLVSVGVDLDPHTPLRKVLELGDAHMRQATTYNDFGRPDLALQEYIKAFTIAVDKVPRHKDYPGMKSDRGDLNRLYNALKSKITTNGATFDKVKEHIKQDNRRSGVQPTTSLKKSSELDVPNPTTTVSNGKKISNESDGHQTKTRPVVQPKPQALHGKAVAINQTQNTSSEDLANRFARLRMPKVPEAIYNPVRGTVTREIANLPSSSPRGLFSRTNSTTSTPSASARLSTENAIRAFGSEQYVTANTYGTPRSSTAPSRPRIPSGDTITAKALAGLVAKYNSQIELLIIDVRDRESFDEGHINYPRTICVEPAVLMRENISADEIADSMVLAPPAERLAMEQRDKVDLVVIYDEDSISLPSRVTGNYSEMVLHNIWQALSFYSYDRPLKYGPKLLKGGLDSWVKEFGEPSLEISNTLSNTLPLNTSSSLGSRNGRRYRHKTRTLNADEVGWFENLIQEETEGAFDYVKSREDFIRRYPSITGEAESMTAPATEEYTEPRRILGTQEEDFLAGMAPAPPRRPAPAIPRTRYSGLESRDDDASTGALAKMAPGAASIGQPLVGLDRGSNGCFANSTLQSLLTLPLFIDIILSDDWPQNSRDLDPGTRAPARPQLLSKILKNQLQWMRRKQFRTMKATTLMQYLHSVHAGDHSPGNLHISRLGDGRQHDVDDLTIFLMSELERETNTRHETGRNFPLPTFPPGTTRLAESATTHWRLMLTASNSFVKDLFGLMTIRTLACTRCKNVRSNFAELSAIYSNFESGAKSDTVPGLLQRYFETNNCIEVDCENTSCPGKEALSNIRVMRLPPLLRLHAGRVQMDAHGTQSKNTTSLAFDTTLDLGPSTFDATVRREVAALVPPNYREGFDSPTEYDLLAIQIHNGPNPSAGHYWAYIRSEPKGGDPDQWIEANDTVIKTYTGQAWRNTLRDIRQAKNGNTPVQLWYKRRDVKWPWETK